MILQSSYFTNAKRILSISSGASELFISTLSHFASEDLSRDREQKTVLTNLVALL